MSENKFDIISEWEEINCVIKEATTIAIFTENGSRAFLKIETGNYFIRKIEEVEDEK